tara:strand:+ start:3196 stop:3870 length:675 start_codon:yes stop_codon:yes gene_type:complete
MNIEQTGMSDSIKNLAVAQANIQKEIEDIAKDSEGYGYKYTSYDALVKHLRPLLTKHGISFIQMPVGHDNQIGVRTVYMHTSGEWISSVVLSPIVESRQMNVYQSVGSAITYFRRYSLSAFVGIASDEDNDASTVQAKPKPKQETVKKPAKVKVSGDPISSTDAVILRGMCKGLGDDVKQKVREGLETNRINAKTIDKTKQWLEGLIDKNNPNLTEEEVNEVFG